MSAETTTGLRGSSRFSARDRVRDGRDYRRIRANGRRLRSQFLTAELAGSESRGRLGLVVSKQVGNAVVRNRVKRRVREWFRTQRQQLPAQLDIVIVARPGSGETSARVLWGELDAIAAQASR